MRFVRIGIFGVLPLLLSAVFVFAQGQVNQRPVISHDPVRVAVKGQPVTVLARVTDDSGYVKSVTLFYSVSPDAAPFRSIMKSSGTSMYYGTIPAAVLDSSDKISYYIEAMDHVDATQETPWYTVNVRAPQQAPPAQRTQPVIQQSAPEPARDQGGMNWKTVGLIGAGAAAVVGGAVLIGSSGGGGGGDDSGGGSGSGTVQVGDYDGSVTKCFTVGSESPSCETHSMTIHISDNGVVSSSTLHSGTSLETTLRGDTFSLALEIDGSGTDGSGEVIYNGTVVGDRILGDISGTQDTTEGVKTYSGTFSANKR